jgi:hypothetical protein
VTALLLRPGVALPQDSNEAMAVHA